jgi:hypothetical protein
MEARKFAIGDRVRLRLDGHINETPADVYTVSRTVPIMANVWQYWVKRVGDGQERAVNEQQLTNAAFKTSAQTFVASLQHDVGVQRIRNARAAERTRLAARRSEQAKHYIITWSRSFDHPAVAAVAPWGGTSLAHLALEV